MVGLVRLATIERMLRGVGPALHVAAGTFTLDLLQLVLHARCLVQQGAEDIAGEENDKGDTGEGEDERWLLSYVADETVPVNQRFLASSRQIC